MQIKKLELSGFKSFMNPVALDFGGGITAILGPNGCGKSNVVDALRWVLGEQSAKQLRGDKMSNVVFGGTKSRKPLSMAEVSVTFSNFDGRMAVPYQEVRLTRRLSRDGVSDYLINGAPARLKDIRDLITDTGAGSHAYSIIEREMVDGVIAGHEDARKFLFEEASGIMKYRLRRREATRKLEMTSSDLLRLNDIIEEISRQVRSLKRQMGRARRYQELHEQIRRAETYLARERLLGYREETSRLQAELEEVRTAQVGDDTESNTVRAAIEALRTGMVEIERRFRAAGDGSREMAERLKACEETLLVLGERIDSTREAQAAARGEIEITAQRMLQVGRDRERLENERCDFAQRVEERKSEFAARKQELHECEMRFEKARAELLEIKQRSFDFAEHSAARKGEIDVVQSRIDAHREQARGFQRTARDASERAARLAEELAALNKRIQALELQRGERQQTLDTLSRRDDELVAALEGEREERAEQRTQLDAVRSQCELLQALVLAYDGYGKGARTLLERHKDGGCVLGSLAEQVHAPRGLEAAFDALLHDVLDALLVRNVDDALKLVRELRDQSLGNATFVVESESASPAQVELRGPGIVGLAIDLLSTDAPVSQTLRQLLASAVIVEDAAAAQRLLQHAADPRLRVVTREGVLFTGHGTVFGGSSTEREVSLLGRRQRLRELEASVRDLEQKLEEATIRCGSIEAALRGCRAERRDTETGLRADEETLMQLSVSRASLETAFEECNSICGTAQKDLAEVEASIESLEGRLPSLTRDVERLSSEGDAKRQAVAAAETMFAQVEKEREQHRHEVSELRVAFVELQGEAESRARQLERLSELEAELRELSTRRQEEVERGGRDLERYGSELGEARTRGAALAAELEAARAAQNEVGLELDAARARLEAAQGQLTEIETARRQQQGRLHVAEMALAECRMRTQNLLERMREHYELDESALLTQTYSWDDTEALPTEEQVRELRGEIGRLGPVNLLALEEFEEKNRRLEFLEAQRADLEQACASLGETIDKINRTAQFLFMETFEQVRSYFGETIRTVFDGGEGELLLTNPEDPLDTDVEIRVRPRGKRIDTLTQLSSGERALTAIALLFSIYLVKPSPFCVFDEVDAPLDDANIGRFVNLIREFRDRTQFIVITHNKLTMEAADRLYGVTMEEEGVSKLVTVALDGELRGAPRKLKNKVDRVARAAAVLSPSAEALSGFDAGVLQEAATGNGDGDAKGQRSAARLQGSNGGRKRRAPAAATSAAAVETSTGDEAAPEDRVV